MSKILLIDGNSLINRAFYAIREMRTVDGFPTNAIHGFFTMLAKILADEKPSHIVAAFDLKGKTFRNDLFDGYKANRKPMPDELAVQLTEVKKLLKKQNIRILEKQGFEADDIIGTVAKRTNNYVVILSGDKDLYQLVDESTNVMYTKRGVSDLEHINLKYLAEKESFSPKQVIEYKALAGDTADNIPGGKGIGDKTARKLLLDYGDVENIFKNIDNIEGALKNKLIDSKGQIELSKVLATINTNVDIEFDINDFKFDCILTKDFVDGLIDFECRKVVDNFKKFCKVEDQNIVNKIQAHVVECNNLTEINAKLTNVIDSISILFDENIYFSFDNKTVYKIACIKSLLDKGMFFDEAIRSLKYVFENPEINKIVFDAKSIMHTLFKYDIGFNGKIDDLMVKQYLINSSRPAKTIDDLAAMYKIDDVSTVDMFNINKIQDDSIDKYTLRYLYETIEEPLIKVLYNMEKEGFKVDVDSLDNLSNEYDSLLHDLTLRIFEIAGENFNINSNQQLSVILFEKLGLSPGKKTKTGYSVSAEVLEGLDHPIVELLLKYRKYMKLNSTYIQGFKNLLDNSTNKVYTIYNQCVAVTGRLSSVEPNMQNIPVRTEEGREIRKVLIASDDNILISADYSQIELRLLAHFSQDDTMISLFHNNADIHIATAAKIYNLPIGNVTNEMRRNAKAVNFGIIYGISSFGLANNIGISTFEAKKFIESYFQTFKRVKKYMEGNVEFARKKGYIRSLSGRIRFFDEFKSSNKNIQNFGARAAMNMPLQGSAADIIKLAMIFVDKELRINNLKSRLILQVHDELLIDCKKEEKSKVSLILKECMEKVVELFVPLVVDIKSGKNWYDI